MSYNGIESLPQTQILKFLFLCILMVLPFDILIFVISSSRIHSLTPQRSTSFGCKDIGKTTLTMFVAQDLPQ